MVGGQRGWWCLTDKAFKRRVMYQGDTLLHTISSFNVSVGVKGEPGKGNVHLNGERKELLTTATTTSFPHARMKVSMGLMIVSLNWGA